MFRTRSDILFVSAPIASTLRASADAWPVRGVRTRLHDTHATTDADFELCRFLGPPILHAALCPNEHTQPRQSAPTVSKL
eukprot:7746158-Ditylum_brightwellii.AAC.1